MKRQGGMRERGLSLIEMMITVSISILAAASIATFIDSTRSGIINVENNTDLSGSTESMGKNLRQSLLGAERLYVNYTDVSGNTTLPSYQPIFYRSVTSSSSGAPLPVAWSVTPLAENLPHAESTTTGSINASLSYGNLLPFAATISPLTIKDITVSGNTLVPGPNVYQMEDVVLDRYQFVMFYLTVDANRKFPGTSGCLRLVEWRSKPFINYNQLIVMTGYKLSLTAGVLNNRGYLYAVNLDETQAGSAFFKISPSATGLCLNSATAGVSSFGEQSWAYMDEFINTQDPNPDPLKPSKHISTINYANSVTGYSTRFSIAYNTKAPTPATMRVNQLVGGPQGVIVVPLYAAPNAINPFPAGFEVGVVGHSGAREIFIRTVQMAMSGARGAAELASRSFPGYEFTTVVSVDTPD